MVRIRLTKAGRRNAPAFRVVVADKKAKRDGKFIELIGHYNPTEDPKKITYKEDRYNYWVSVGAQPSETVKKLIEGTYVFKPYNPNAKDEEPVQETEAQTETAEENAPEAETTTE